MEGGPHTSLPIIICGFFLVGISVTLSDESTKDSAKAEKAWTKQIPILLSFADHDSEVPDDELKPVKVLVPKDGIQGSMHNTLRMVVHGVGKHSHALFSQPKTPSFNDTSVEYIDEEEDVGSSHPRRVKRWGHHHGHHHQQHHMPVSLDFGCNSDNMHDISFKDKTKIRGHSSTDTTSSDTNEKQPLSLFIKRPHMHMRPHHHGPHLTFRCNTNNHHTFRSYRNFRSP